MIHTEELNGSYNAHNRRQFIYNVSAIGAAAMLATPVLTKAANFIAPDEQYTVQQIIDLFIKDVPGGAIKNTVDTLKAGSPDTKVTGIVTTMFATIAVIRKAIELGANFIIAHEPTFYNHEDKTDWLKDDKVYQFKADLLKQHGIAVWRNHDYIHSLIPDGVLTGVLDRLDWKIYADSKVPELLIIPSTPLKEVIGHAKSKLNIDKVRYIGDPGQKCSRIIISPGAAGERKHIDYIHQYKPDLLMVGELSEWETAEYVRDARASGQDLSLVVLGHIASEEPGSEFMLNWLKQKVTGIKVSHVPSGNSLSFL